MLRKRMLLLETLQHFREFRHRGDAAAPLDAERSGCVAEAGIVRRVVDRDFFERLAGGKETIEKSAEEGITRAGGVHGVCAETGDEFAFFANANVRAFGTQRDRDDCHPLILQHIGGFCGVSFAREQREFFVGNLYFNRKCTGAMVGAHPFGGFNMSGTDSKAGGPDYLLQFVQAKSIAVKL